MQLAKYIFIYVCIFSFKLSALSQTMQVGQYLPDYTIKHVLNYKTNELNFKEFQGKLIIIDFWGFYCTACLKRFQELDSLQKEFAGKIQIILVNSNSKNDTKAFFEARQRLKIPGQVPLVTADTILHKLFPHDGVPSYVWIDSTGKILYKTDESVSKELLNKYFNKQTLAISKSSKNEYLPSLFNQEFQNNIKYATYISSSTDSVFLHIDDSDNIPYRCRSVMELYQFAYNESDNEGFYKFREPGRTVLKISDSIKYKYIPTVDYDKWRSQYGYYYHEMLPSWLKKDKYKIMQEDLQRYFNLEVEIKKRPVKCFILIRTSKQDLLKTKGGKSEKTDFSYWIAAKDDDPDHPPIRFLKNQPFSSLFDIIQGYGYWQFQTKIVDSTDYNGNIDFLLNENVLNNLTIQKLRIELQKFGLDIIEKSIPMDVLVLKEK